MKAGLLTRRRAAAPPAATAKLPPEAAAVLGALPVAAVVLDDEDRFRFANPAAELFFQLSAPSLAALSLCSTPVPFWY